MKSIKWRTWVEVELEVCADIRKGYPQAWHEPGCPDDLEIRDIFFIRDDAEEIETLEELKNHIIKKDCETLVAEGWEEVE